MTPPIILVPFIGFRNTTIVSLVFFRFHFHTPHLHFNTRGGILSVARGNTIPVAPVTVYDAVGRATAHVLGRARWWRRRPTTRPRVLLEKHIRCRSVYTKLSCLYSIFVILTLRFQMGRNSNINRVVIIFCQYELSLNTEQSEIVINIIII